MGTNAADSRKRSPGMVLVVMLISMVAGSICMNKVAPVLTNIVSDLAIANSTLSGMLMSIFVISGIFLSIPMGMLTTKYGTFKTGLFSLAAIIIGSSMGAVAGNYTLLLVSRMVEGIGLMFLATIGPAAVASSFSDEKRGTADVLHVIRADYCAEPCAGHGRLRYMEKLLVVQYRVWGSGHGAVGYFHQGD